MSRCFALLVADLTERSSVTYDQDLPPCDDGTGYSITRSDLEFLQLAADDLADMLARVRPLGMSARDFTWVVDELEYALERDGITDADVRLQGSSANLWSGWHKQMPFDREQVLEILSRFAQSTAETLTIDRCLDVLDQQWPASRARPTRRPFDSLYRAQIEPQRSDYDIQISSDQMIEAIRRDVARRGVEVTKIQVENETYRFVEKRYAVPALRYVGAWADRATEMVERPVSWAVFPSAGPSRDESNERLSSHFKASDWIVIPSYVAELSGSDATL